MKVIKILTLFSYWSFLTKLLLSSAPWELISQNLAEHPPFDLSFEPISWTAHFLAYFALGLLIKLATRGNTKTYWTLLFLALIHGGVCEYFQSFVPGRWPNIWDVVANSIGLMFFLAYGLRSRRNPKHPFEAPLSKTSPKKQAA